ncbi:hypothetical protein EYV94_22295 [Puteibacter caeruleilacunae]|nr:hypothetical protein EYV94_22295 [Puteibacter caeruleilacunae]
MLRKKRLLSFLLIVLILLVIGGIYFSICPMQCQKLKVMARVMLKRGFYVRPELPNISGEQETYLFVGHPYKWHTRGDKVDERLEVMDLKERFDGIWLGGDVCSEALLKYTTVEYMDRVFDLKNPMTFFVMGNHDARNGNWEWLEQATGRKTYYAHYHKGVTYLVINTNLTPAHCEELDEQYEIISNVCDTINSSSHLVVFTHHGVWNNIPGLPKPTNYAHSGLEYYNFNCDDVESTFEKAIYPKLIDVHARGVEVVCLIGDMGGNKKKVDKKCDNGIYFLGCGLNNSKYKNIFEYLKQEDDLVLVFTHIPGKRSLTWDFVPLNELM